MSCIGGRRRELKMEKFMCPYPGCGWETEWNPDLGLAVAKANVDIETHRREHGHEPYWSNTLGDVGRSGGGQP